MLIDKEKKAIKKKSTSLLFGDTISLLRDEKNGEKSYFSIEGFV